jgi:pimeloyl-ACP methyl ester carboxylesterase
MVDSPAKSTNVRLHGLRFVFRGLAAASPQSAARALEALFLRTRRRPLPHRERIWLRAARPSGFQSRGKRLSAWTWGEGPNILLTHGWEGRGSQLGAFVEPLVAAGYRVVTFDAPGHGRSPGRRSSLVEMADAIFDATRHFGAIHGLVAHSAGAAAATIAMSRGLEVGRVVFIAPPLELGSYLALLTRWLGLDEKIARLAQERIERRLEVRWQELTLPPLAGAMSAPLLLFHDQDDREIPFENGETLARAWPRARLEKTSGLGHRRILRDPLVVENAVRFLGGSARPTATL